MKSLAVCVLLLTAEPLSENQAPKIICYPQKKVTQTAENLAIHSALNFRFGHHSIRQTNQMLTRTQTHTAPTHIDT